MVTVSNRQFSYRHCMVRLVTMIVLIIVNKRDTILLHIFCTPSVISINFCFCSAIPFLLRVVYMEVFWAYNVNCGCISAHGIHNFRIQLTIVMNGCMLVNGTACVNLQMCIAVCPWMQTILAHGYIPRCRFT